MNDFHKEYIERTKKEVESMQQRGYSSQEMEDQWRRNHELSLQRKGMQEKKTNQSKKKH